MYLFRNKKFNFVLLIAFLTSTATKFISAPVAMGIL